MRILIKLQLSPKDSDNIQPQQELPKLHAAPDHLRLVAP